MKINNIKLKIRNVWICLLGILVTIKCIFSPLGIKVLILKISPSFINLILFLVVLISPVIFWKPEKSNFMWIKLAYNVIATIIVLATILLYPIFYSENKYFMFKSPNGNRNLIVEEKSFLLSGSSYFYEKKFGIFIKSLDKGISTDDGYRPFSDNQYKLTWIDNSTVKLEYDYGSMGIWKSEIIDLD